LGAIIIAMKPDYVALRMIRRFMPEKLTRTLLRRGLVIKPGLETREPQQAALRYRNALLEKGISLEGKHILVFGYGGRFAIGVELLRLGAAHVTLTDLFAPPDDRRNDHLLPEFGDYLEAVDGKVRPKEQVLTLLHGDIRQTAARLAQQPLDGVLSTSVYEHLDDVEGITQALRSTLKPGGFFVAYIDLRDHYFKYPFEMLCYSEPAWKNWLNPTSNLNRLRLRDYRAIFDAVFPGYDLVVLERDAEQFDHAKARIRPEFLSGSAEDDAVMQIRVIASA
jgi:SAM-dependent methyltransferase